MTQKHSPTPSGLAAESLRTAFSAKVLANHRVSSPLQMLLHRDFALRMQKSGSLLVRARDPGGETGAEGRPSFGREMPKKPIWPSNSKLNRYAGCAQAQQLLVKRLETPPFLPATKTTEANVPRWSAFTVYFALFATQRLGTALVWNEVLLRTDRIQFVVVMHWLLHQQLGGHVENVLFNYYKDKVELYRDFFGSGLLFLKPWSTFNDNVEKFGFPPLQVLYNKATLARLIRLHLNLFNPLLNTQGRKLRLLHPLIRALVRLSREEGNYKYVLACMHKIDLTITKKENGSANISVEFSGLSTTDNKKLNDELLGVQPLLSAQLHSREARYNHVEWQKQLKKEDSMGAMAAKVASWFFLGSLILTNKHDLVQSRTRFPWHGPQVAVMMFAPVGMPTANPRGTAAQSGPGSSSRAAGARRIFPLQTPPRALYQERLNSENVDEFAKETIVVSFNSADEVSIQGAGFYASRWDGHETKYWNGGKFTKKKCALTEEQLLSFVDTQCSDPFFKTNVRWSFVYVDTANKRPTEFDYVSNYQVSVSKEGHRAIKHALKKNNITVFAGFADHDRSHPHPAMASESMGQDHATTVVLASPKRFNGTGGWDNQSVWESFRFCKNAFVDVFGALTHHHNQIETILAAKHATNQQSSRVPPAGVSDRVEATVNRIQWKIWIKRQKALSKLSYWLQLLNINKSFQGIMATQAYKEEYVQLFGAPLLQLNYHSLRGAQLALQLSKACEKINSSFAFDPFTKTRTHTHSKSIALMSQYLGDCLTNTEHLSANIDVCYEMFHLLINLHSSMVGHSQAENGFLRARICQSWSGTTARGVTNLTPLAELDEHFVKFLQQNYDQFTHRFALGLNTQNSFFDFVQRHIKTLEAEASQMNPNDQAALCLLKNDKDRAVEKWQSVAAMLGSDSKEVTLVRERVFTPLPENIRVQHTAANTAVREAAVNEALCPTPSNGLNLVYDPNERAAYYDLRIEAAKAALDEKTYPHLSAVLDYTSTLDFFHQESSNLQLVALKLATLKTRGRTAFSGAAHTPVSRQVATGSAFRIAAEPPPPLQLPPPLIPAHQRQPSSATGAGVEQNALVPRKK